MITKSLKVLLCSSFVLGLSLQVHAGHKENHVDVKTGALSDRAKYGAKVFKDNCAQCHGENGSGSDKGPPLIHSIYNPGHHSNQSIMSAIKNGTQQHHWPFGDMPAQEQITFMQVPAIIQYIREMQEINGIKTVPHKM